MNATFSKDGSRYRLALVRNLSHSPEKVWRAITESEYVSQWFPADIHGDWRVGAELRFEFRHGEGDGLPEDQLRGQVTRLEPNRLLEFHWGDSTLRYELIPEGDGCRLLFSETLGDPSWGARNAAGWEMCLDNLGLIIDGASAAAFAWDAWRDKFRHYVAKFEPEFGEQDEPPEDIRPE